ncbi:hypothetical protein M0802_008413 [Mischocyttarus mexicanus]|nr:hypothetical protein M0802_008413 [Mischocyttarus mexicanus]
MLPEPLKVPVFLARRQERIIDINESSDEKNTKERIEERSVLRVPDAGKIVKGSNKIATHGNLFLNRLQQNRKDYSKKDHNKINVNAYTVKEKTNDDYLRGRLKKKKRRRKNRAMMALLLAYKMKFMALLPTLLGGFILLIGKALLAGFFFALFAAVLSLKSH